MIERLRLSCWWVNLPLGFDDSGDGGVQVQLGDEAVGEAEEDLRALLGRRAVCLDDSDLVNV